MNNDTNIKHDINKTWWLLRITYALGFLAAGADKFIHIFEDWSALITKATLILFNIDLTRFLQIIGGIELFIGFLLLTRFTKTGAYFAMLWLLAKAGYIFHTGHFREITARYVVIAMGALALAWLSNTREKLASQECECTK